MTRARAKLPMSDGYKSDIERSWALDGRHYLLARYGCSVEMMVYEPLSINLPGGRYTPDFMAILGSGLVIFIECKGGRNQRGYRDARSKLRAAAALHPWADWIEAIGSNGRFELELINDDTA